jgi:hypothetical protein
MAIRLARRTVSSSMLTVMLVAAPRAVLACPVCFGQSDSPLASAINMGVIMMLGVVAVMLGSFAAFFVYLNRRAKLVAGGTANPADAGSHLLASTNPEKGTAQC